jgi:hypothetical protein
VAAIIGMRSQQRAEVSPFNLQLRREGRVHESNPTDMMGFFPIEKRVKYVPLSQDIHKVIETADRDIQDYLWTIWETLARISEINRLTWEDVQPARAICYPLYAQEEGRTSDP